jgi:hypothetical protein
MGDNVTFVYNITENNNTTTTITPEDDGQIPPKLPTLSDILMEHSEYVWAVNLGIYVFPVIIGNYDPY